MKLKTFMHGRKAQPSETEHHSDPAMPPFQDEELERFDHDCSILDDTNGDHEDQIHRKAQKEIKSAAEQSLIKLHVIQSGLCPHCGEPLRKHLFASICRNCGWHTFDVPRSGPVRVHLTNSPDIIEGERCYNLKSGGVLVVRNDMVTARIPNESVSWVEYIWGADEITQRHRQVVDRMAVHCAWCDQEADTDEDGFHLVQVAFGSTQERYCLCSDDCYEAFRKMYPARVHRNCYENSCSECNLCIKQYTDEADELYMLAKGSLKQSKKGSHHG